MEDPGGPEVLTTSPPEVLISAPPMNLSNDSLLDYREENAAEIKFYLPVSAKIHKTRSTTTLCTNGTEISSTEFYFNQ